MKFAKFAKLFTVQYVLVYVLNDLYDLKQQVFICMQEVFSAVRDRYMRDGEGFLLVYSLTQRSTFIPLEKVYEQIKRVKDTSRVPVVLVGNKVSYNQLILLNWDGGNNLVLNLFLYLDYIKILYL